MIREINKEQGLHLQLITDEGNISKIKMSYGMFKNVHGFIAMAGRKDDPDLKEKLGYYGEKLVLLAAATGLGTCWVGSTYKKDSCVCDLEQGESLEAVITVGYVEADKRTKEKMISSFVKKKGKKADQMLKTEEKIPDWIMQGMEAVEKAPSALNAQPVEFRWKDGKFTAHVRSKMDLKRLIWGSQSSF